MKKQLSLVKQLAAVAVTGSMICFVNSASAQSAGAEPTVEPGRVGSMSGVGQKPRKGENQKESATTSSQTTGGTSKTGATTAQSGSGDMSNMDRTFLMQAAKDGMKEVHMGQMAVQQGQSDDVKKLGRTIAADHTKANQQLMAIAMKKGISPDTKHEMKMSKRDMKNFDQAWIGMMINDHQKDIAVYERQAQQGTDPDLKAFAKKTLPVLQKHLKLVQQAQQKMGSGGTNPAGMAPSAGATKSGR